MVHLQTIAILRSDTQVPKYYQCQNENLSIELETFYKELNIEALRQMTIKKPFVEQRLFKKKYIYLSFFFSREIKLYILFLGI